MFQFPGLAPDGLYIHPPVTPSGCPVTPGFPIRRSPDQCVFDHSPGHIAAYHVLHRLSTPRHPPCTLSSLTTLMRGRQRPIESSRRRGQAALTTLESSSASPSKRNQPKSRRRLPHASLDRPGWGEARRTELVAFTSTYSVRQSLGPARPDHVLAGEIPMPGFDEPAFAYPVVKEHGGLGPAQRCLPGRTPEPDQHNAFWARVNGAFPKKTTAPSTGPLWRGSLAGGVRGRRPPRPAGPRWRLPRPAAPNQMDDRKWLCSRA